MILLMNTHKIIYNHRIQPKSDQSVQTYDFVYRYLTQSSIYNYLIQPKFEGKKIYDFGFTFQPLDQSVQSKILLMDTYAII